MNQQLPAHLTQSDETKAVLRAQARVKGLCAPLAKLPGVKALFDKVAESIGKTIDGTAKSSVHRDNYDGRVTHALLELTLESYNGDTRREIRVGFDAASSGLFIQINGEVIDDTSFVRGSDRSLFEVLSEQPLRLWLWERLAAALKHTE